jgi:hypothetical protein
MKENSISKEFEWLGTYYKVTRHIGSEVIEISEKVPNGFWGKHDLVWKRIYFGHTNPLEEAINFFKNSKL